jgi:hypothetical protein
VDDVIKTLVDSTPATGLASFVMAEHSAHTAPDASLQGTGLPCGGSSVVVTPVRPLVAQVAFGARFLSLVGVRPRGAPV